MKRIIKSYRDFDTEHCSRCGAFIPLPDRYFILSDEYQAPLCRACWWNGKPKKKETTRQ
jgi:hypothetical protein